MAEEEIIMEKVKDKNISKNLKIRVLDEAICSFKEILMNMPKPMTFQRKIMKHCWIWPIRHI